MPRLRGDGRGRLSAIEQLPETASHIISWAAQELAARKRTQLEILDDLNEKLATEHHPPLPPISRSAFNRYSIFQARFGERLVQAREIASVFAEKASNLPDGDIGLLLNETIKTLVFDVLTDAVAQDKPPSLELLETAANALEKLERGRRHNIKALKEARAAFAKEAVDAVEQAAAKAGLSPDTVKAFREKILGVVAKPDTGVA